MPQVWAEECFEWARTAHDERVREQYANLGQIWLECAVRAELWSGAYYAAQRNEVSEFRNGSEADIAPVNVMSAWGQKRT